MKNIQTNMGKWFGVTDLANMLCSLKISQESQPQSTFTVESQQYTFSQMPEGDVTSPAIAHGLWRQNLDACPPSPTRNSALALDR